MWLGPDAVLVRKRDVANCRAGGLALDRGATGSRASCSPWSLWEVGDGGPLLIVLRTVRIGCGLSSGTRNSLRPLSATTKQKEVHHGSHITPPYRSGEGQTRLGPALRRDLRPHGEAIRRALRPGPCRRAPHHRLRRRRTHPGHPPFCAGTAGEPPLRFSRHG